MSLGSEHLDVLGKQVPLIPEPPKPNAKDPDALAPIVAHRLDFAKLGLPEYRHKFALVVDNLFTAQDCARYFSIAEASKDWNLVALNEGRSDLQYINTSYRNSGRVVVDDEKLAGEILARLRPYLKEIEHLEKSPLHKQFSEGGSFSHEPPAQLSRFNQELRFLKYGPGQYFRKHCDGVFQTPDKKELSYYTLQLYLNGSAQEIQGGATRFWRMGNLKKRDVRRALPGMPLRDFVDVEPRRGRALIFEQSGIWHSGEEVNEGIKYTIRADLLYKACPGWEQEDCGVEIAFE